MGRTWGGTARARGVLYWSPSPAAVASWRACCATVKTETVAVVSPSGGGSGQFGNTLPTVARERYLLAQQCPTSLACSLARSYKVAMVDVDCGVAQLRAAR